MNSKRRERISEALEGVGADYLVATSAENVFYTVGFESESQFLMRDTEVYAIVPRDTSRPGALVVGRADLDLASERPPSVSTVLSYGTFFIEPQAPGSRLSVEDERLAHLLHDHPPYDSAAEAVLAVVRHLDLLGSMSAVDETGLQPEAYHTLLQTLVSTQPRPAGQILRALRAVKDAVEVEALRKTADITLHAIQACLKELHEGVTEIEAVQLYEQAVLAEGARPTFAVIAFGERAAHPNALPSGRILQRGDVVRFDVGCRFGWYHADLARTASAGRPTPWTRDGFKAILAGELTGLDALRPGLQASDIFDKTVEAVRTAGLPEYRRHHVGHGIGIELYEPPLLGPRDHTALAEGNVVNVETPYYVLGVGGLQVEDAALITADGAELLSPPQHELHVI